MSTTIRIGHATISENDSAYGVAGDQKGGNEVCIVDDYDVVGRLAPNVVLRPKSNTLAKLSADACVAGCNNNHIGYSQSGRNTLYEYAENVKFNLSEVTTDCNTDCSAFMTVCAIAGGSKIAYGSNAPTTSNMRTRFKQSGDYTILTDSKHLTKTDYLKRGDILVHEGSHTVMVLENGGSYEDDTTEPEGGGSTLITTITDIRINHISVNMSVIEETKATANIKVLEQKAGVADKALSSNKIKNYNWTYILETITKTPSTALTKRNQIDLTTNKYNISLTGLKAETTYALQVIATNKKTGNKDFCSSKIIFTTLPSKIETKDEKQEFVGKPVNAIDHIYIKIDDEFKPTMIYNNI